MTFIRNPTPGAIAAILLVSSFCWMASAQNTVQHFGYYANSDCSGTGRGLWARYGSAFTWDVVSVRGMGNWIFYDQYNYQGNSEVVTLRSINTCAPLQDLASRAASVKHAGDPLDYSAPSITIYKGNNFNGREMYIEGDNPKALLGESGFTETFGSYVITGGSSSCWTLYEVIAYNAVSDTWNQVCVCGQGSPTDGPLLVRSNPFPPDNQIGSVRKGCQTGLDSVVSALDGKHGADGFVVME